MRMPATGRWTTPDPIGFADGPNLYAYVKNSPLTHFDAYGLLGAGTGSSSLYDTNRANRSTKPLSREPSGPSWWDRAVDKGRCVFGSHIVPQFYDANPERKSQPSAAAQPSLVRQIPSTPWVIVSLTNYVFITL